MMRVFLVLATLWLAAAVWADGKAYASSGKPVGIPFQRAVILYEDGIQTMAIQNSLTEGGDLNWVIPVPSRETEFLEGPIPDHLFEYQFSTRALRTPATPSYLQRVVAWMAALAVLFALISLGAIRGRAHGLFAAAAFLLIALGWAVFFPVFMQAKSSTRGVVMLRSFETERVRADLVAGDDPAALRDWLVKNNTPLPPEDEPILAEYIRDGWSFAAIRIKVRAEGEGGVAPLLLQFPTQKPVYPMRLTSTATDRLVLDLAVWQPEAPLGTPGAHLIETIRTPRLRLGLPEREPVTGWKTRMRGVYSAEQMRAGDLSFHALPAKSSMAVLKSRQVEGWEAAIKGLYPFLLLMPVLALMPLPRWRTLRAWALVLALTAIVLLPFSGWWPRSNPWAREDVLALILLYLSPLVVLLMGWLGRNQPPEDAPIRLRLALGVPLLVGVALAVSHIGSVGGAPTLNPDGSISNLPTISASAPR